MKRGVFVMFILFFLFVVFINASKIKFMNDQFILKEKYNKKRFKRFRCVKAARRDSYHQIIIEVQSQNEDSLDKLLDEVSNPNHPKYGKFLNYPELTALMNYKKPLFHVKNFLNRYNIKIENITLNGEFIVAKAPVFVMEKILNTKLYEFELIDPSLSMKFIRAFKYYIPRNISNFVKAIFNVVHLPDPNVITNSNPLNVKLSSISKVHGYVTPQLINDVYSIRSNQGNNLASQAVYETLDQTFSPNDLVTFQKKFGLPIDAVDIDINGHSSNTACNSNNGNNCIEANLDVQYLLAVSQYTPTTYYYWNGNDFLLDWILQVSNMKNPPLVFSISYGVDESELSDSYVSAFDLVAKKLAVKGVTIVASSGDDGAVSSRVRKSSLFCGYDPSFPASSPYVTAVGGTMGPESDSSEVACQSNKNGIITTGGGFSKYYSTPTWQSAAVSNYFDKIDADHTINPVSGYNKRGRGFPDVSLLAHNYIIAAKNNFTAVSGTSASSPVFAGMVSLINANRLSQGKSSLGWINPTLYQYYDHFINDIQQGDNRCASMGLICCSQGFFATTGWDPVTGLGSVNFDSMKNIFMGLGDKLNIPTISPTTKPGNPTLKPFPKETSYPSMTPSFAPTLSSGWLYFRKYSGPDCQGEIEYINGMKTGECLVEYDSALKPVGSTKVYCDKESATIEYFSDSLCSKIQDKETLFSGCAYSVRDTYYSSAYSSDIFCTKFPSEIPYLPYYNGKYVVQMSYNSKTGCSPESISSYSAYLNNHCFEDEKSSYSYKFLFPKLTVYNGIDCKNKPQSKVLSEQCASTVQSTSRSLSSTTQDLVIERMFQEKSYSYYYYEGSSFDDVHEEWKLGTFTLPTEKPSPTPSCRPTVHPIIEASKSPSFRPSSSPLIIQQSSIPSRTHLNPRNTLCPSSQYTTIPTKRPSKTSRTPSSQLIPSIQPTTSPTMEVKSASSQPSPAQIDVKTQSPTLIRKAPTQAPTQTLTQAPTQVPSLLNSRETLKYIFIHIILNQTLIGINTKEYSLNQEANDEILKNSIKASLIDYSLSISVINSRPLGLIEGYSNNDGLAVVYKIDLKTNALHDPSEVFSKFYQKLNAILNNGTIDENIHSLSIIYSSHALLSSQTKGLSILSYQIGDSQQNSSSSNKFHSIGAMIIAFLIVTSIVFFVVSVFYCSKFNRTKSSKTLYTEVAIGENSVRKNRFFKSPFKKKRFVALDIVPLEEDDEAGIEIKGNIKNKEENSDKSSYNPLIHSH